MPSGCRRGCLRRRRFTSRAAGDRGTATVAPRRRSSRGARVLGRGTDGVRRRLSRRRREGAKLAAGADPRARRRRGAADDDGQTALHVAARAGAPASVVAAVAAAADGADTVQKNARNENSRGPKANSRNDKSRGEMARRYGGGVRSVDRRDAWGRTPLHWAAVNGHRAARCFARRRGEAAAGRRRRDPDGRRGASRALLGEREGRRGEGIHMGGHSDAPGGSGGPNISRRSWRTPSKGG